MSDPSVGDELHKTVIEHLRPDVFPVMKGDILWLKALGLEHKTILYIERANIKKKQFERG